MSRGSKKTTNPITSSSRTRYLVQCDQTCLGCPANTSATIIALLEVVRNPGYEPFSHSGQGGDGDDGGVVNKTKSVKQSTQQKKDARVEQAILVMVGGIQY